MMNYYAQGGLANIAQSLANKGRNGDTELVHMSPKEVSGLQTLAKANGTTLTINPNTGLPEAFRLEQLLPMAAGAALTATGVGAPLAALMVGGAYGAATGSIEKGLMAGIGAYGGAGLTTGLSAAGASAAAPEIATQTGTQALGEAAATESFAGANQAAQMDAATEAFAGSGSTANQTLGANQAAQMTAANQPPTLSNVGRGIESLGTSQGRSIAYGAMPTGTLPATATSLLMAGQQQPNVPGYQEDAYDRRLKGYRLAPNYQPYQAPTPNPYYRPSYAAAGGVMNSFDDEAGLDMAGGGIADLGGYSDGGRMLKGPGDGMSDSIPGVIGGKQPARLADGEFVVPADVVSHLGNGSTDAGAKRLYSMMDKIRQARTGKKKQAPQVNVDKYLPTGKASGGITGYAEGGEVKRFQNEGLVTEAQKTIRDNVENAYNKGFSSAQIGAALIRAGVSQEDAANATKLDANAIAQIYTGGAALGDADIGKPAGNFMFDASGMPISRGITESPKIINGAVISSPTTPVTTTQTPQTYSDQQVLNAINASLKQGVGLEDTKNALRTRYGVDDAQLYRVADLYNKPTTTTQTPVTPAPTAKSYSDQEVLNAILASMKAGFTLEQSKQGARDKYGVTDAQLNKVATLYNESPTYQSQYKEIAAAQQAAAFNDATSKSIAAYRPSFVPRVSGISMSPTMQDPYSDLGLKSLYEQMMGQYQKPTPPMSDAEIRTFAQDFANRNPGKGAELGQALINKGIPVNQAIAATGLSPGTLNTAYIGGQALGTAAPPTLNTQYNYVDPGSYYRPAPVSNLVLKNPITDAVLAEANQAKADATTAATAKATADAGSPNRAGGLMSIDRKKRAKYKT